MRNSALIFVSLLFLSANGVLAQTGDVEVSINTTWPEGVYNLDSLTVNSGAVLTIAGGSTVNVVHTVTITGASKILLQGKNTAAQVDGQWAGIGVTIHAADIQIGSGSQISADGCGYGPYAGPGGGTNYYVGGTYGGQGYSNSLPTYGSYLAPTDLGSGGGAYYAGGSFGGGAIRLVVTGTLTNNGTITANGYVVSSGNSGGGAGGSIYVTTGTIAGSGMFTANGAPGFNGDPGGGGRVAIYYAVNNGFNLASITANGGGGSAKAGTTYLLEHGANLYVPTNLYLPVDTAASYTNVAVFNNVVFTIGGGSSIAISNALTVTGNSTMLLLSKNNTGQVDGQWQGAGVTINAGAVQIDAGSKISAEGTGYINYMGPGGGDNYYVGGTYGGSGKSNTKSTYGSALTPTDLGSGGGAYYAGGSSGGGAIRLIVSGTLANNGTITANGYVASGGNSGGGAGGSIYVTTGTIAGSGMFTADGAPGFNGDPGGGGRVAIYYTVNNGFNPASATANAGGSGASAGTVYILQNNADLYVTTNLYFPQDTTATYANVMVSNGALLTLGGGSSITVSNTLTVTGNSTILLLSKNNGGQVDSQWQGAGVTINAGNVLIHAGSKISAEGTGYGAYLGPGGGDNYHIGGTYGGSGQGNTKSTYGSALAPTDLGSGGGATGGGDSRGGGAIRMIVSGTLTNNGSITANGYVASGGNSGGGSGGSIYITTGTIAGTGAFTANGAPGFNGDPGGGGRVAMYYTTNSAFNPTVLTANAGGASAEAGSVVFINSLSNNLMIPGGRLVIAQDSSLSFNDISIESGALLILWGGSTLNAGGTLSIAGSSTISVRSKDNTAQVGGQWIGQGATIVASNVIVASGGTINAIGTGYINYMGPGGGDQYYVGGTYGGSGQGNSKSTYGSALTPTDLGSGGGAYYAGGSSGGGAIRMIVSGTLTNNGTITANGYVASGGNSGGGSGGSIYVTTGTIAGSGLFTADGAPGFNGNAGGGGRIAIYYEGGTFNPTSITANAGGTGAGAGTVLFTQIVRVTVSSNPTGLNFTVDGTTYTSAQTFTWNVGSAHTIATTSPQTGGVGTQYVFSTWSDGGGISHGVTAASAVKTYLATFTTKYQLTTAVSPPGSGSVVPLSGSYYDAGVMVNLAAAPAANYKFDSWTGPVADSSAASTTVTMSAPRTVTANFVPVVDVTVTATPAGRSFTVDGNGYTSAQTFSWVVGSTHAIATTSPQGTGGTRYVFTNWSDGGALSHSVTVPASPITYTAAFTTQHRLTSTAAPAIGGTITAQPSSADGYYDSDATVQLTAAPNSGYVFTNWAGDLTGTMNPQNVGMSAPRSVTATFAAVVSVTVTTNPPGLGFTADGNPYASAQTFNWVAGSNHTIATTSPQGTGGTRYVFASWSDGGTLSHGVAVPASPITYTASFTTQYQLTTAAAPVNGGSVAASPSSADGFYNSGTPVQLTATANSEFTFANWSGDLTGTANPQNVNMSAPRSVTANFTAAVGVNVTVNTSPPGLGIIVDDTGYTSPQTFSWVSGSNHSISTNSPQGVAGTRYVFANWSDAGAMTHQVTTPASATTYTVTFTTQYQLTFAATPVSGGSVSASPSSADNFYNNGTPVQLTAGANSGYTFTGWSGDLAGTTNPQTVNMSAPRSVTANFAAVVDVNVTTIPAGLNITVDGNTYAAPRTFSWIVGSNHTVATVSPQGSGGTRYVFANWSDGGGVSHGVTVPASPVTYTVNFTTQYQLTTTSVPSNGGSISASPSSSDGFYNSGATVQLTATANTGYSFTGWSGDLTGTANPQNVSMTAPRSVAANFGALVNVTVTTAPTGLSFSVDGNSYSSSQTFSWLAGSNHNIATTSPQGAGGTRYVFSNWSDGGGMSHNIATPTNPASFTASFTTRYRLTTATAPANGGSVSASPSSVDGFYDSNATVQLTAAANPDYTFANWSGDLTGTTNPQNVAMSAPRSVTANFTAAQSVAITVNSVPPGLGFTVDGINYTNAQAFSWVVGSNHSIGTTSPQGSGSTRYVFNNWSDGGAMTHNVTTPANATTYAATFTTQYQLTAASAPAGSGTVSASPSSPDGFYASGATVQLTAAASSGYTFVDWSGDLTGTTNPQNVSMTAPRSVMANFAAAVSVTVTASPPGLSFTVDGQTYSSAQTFTWIVRSSHSIGTRSPQGTGDTRYVFANWSDKGAMTHDVIAPSSDATYTVSFTTQYLLTTSVAPAGMGAVSVAPSSVDGFYDSGTVVALTAVPGAGYKLSNWTGDLSGASSPQSVTMSSPRSVTANFVVLVPDYILSTGPHGNSEDSVRAGRDASYKLLATPVDGFTGVLSLSCAGLPDLASCAFRPDQPEIRGTRAESLTVLIATSAPGHANDNAPATPPGTYQIILTVTSGGLSHSLSLTLIVR